MIKRLLPLALTIFLCLFGITSNAIAQSNNLQENKKIAMQAIELWLSGTNINPEAIFASDYINNLDSATNSSAGPQKRNLKEFEEEVKKFHSAFEDIKLLNSMQAAEGDLVSTHVIISAKHNGSFMGETPTKKTITWDAVEFVKIKDGKIKETWVTWDKYGFLKQLGILK
ncbi:ester cyclase [Microbulbifer variabilis]|uniref:ester cyclase n=1 Tax=Microbulbifer variabilis TaxID=266805 RepID=UPI001CFE1D1B|nr:ester cyclase [Microbulbifer variabilis]